MSQHKANDEFRIDKGCVCFTSAVVTRTGCASTATMVFHHHPPQAGRSQSMHTHVCYIIDIHFVNDPSAGSPTETLLRLLLPLSAPVRTSFRRTRLSQKQQRTPVQGSHWYTQSVVATGGVYKGQGLSHSGLSDPPLLGIPRWWERIASPRPKHASVQLHEGGSTCKNTGFQRVTRSCRSRRNTCCARHCSARAAQSI